MRLPLRSKAELAAVIGDPLLLRARKLIDDLCTAAKPRRGLAHRFEVMTQTTEAAKREASAAGGLRLKALEFPYLIQTKSGSPNFGYK
jgi:hypothetical protein